MYNDGAKEFKCYLNPTLDRRKARFRDEYYDFTLPASCPNDAVDNHKIIMSTLPPHLHTGFYACVFLPLLNKPKGLVYGRPIYWDRNVVQFLVFFFFSFWHSEKEFERTTFYTLSLAVSIGMACSPSRQEGVLPKVNFVFCFKLILNGESC